MALNMIHGNSGPKEELFIKGIKREKNSLSPNEDTILEVSGYFSPYF